CLVPSCSSCVSSSFYLFPFFSFSLLLLRPPNSTLFPYTTLFRSILWQHAIDNRNSVWLMNGTSLQGFKGIAYSPNLDWKVAVVGDRKSTRLNSSHVKISYAVFCLKKKTPLYLTPLALVNYLHELG